MDQNNSYDSVVSGNHIYSQNRTRWQFLLDSYMGGAQYQAGSYLTRYQLETQADYNGRLAITPLDNQVRSIISTYISFLFRQPPLRELGNMDSDSTVHDFLKDCDWEGRDLSSFMKQASIYSNVFGHTWIVMSKPDVGAVTRADEMALAVRPYLNLMSPLVVTDWKWTRRLNGSYELSYLKYVEDANGSVSVIKEWTPGIVTTTTVDSEKQAVTDQLVELNGLGRIPAVCLYAHTSAVRGIGVSTVSDIADTQKLIYNLTSEAEQSIRLSSHPSLVTTKGTNVGTGAGALIHLEDHLDPALKPYVLEFSGQEVSSVYGVISSLVESIDKMANTGSIRATESKLMSGVSREVEFQLLNAKLSEQADNIELAEEQLWKLFAAYQAQEWHGKITYPDSFAIRDVDNDLSQLIKAKGSIENPVSRAAIDSEIMTLLELDPESMNG